jgi:putative DNA primase/helicase
LKAININPDFGDIESPSRIKSELKKSIKKSKAIPHEEILDRLLEQLEPLEFEKIVFRNLEKQIEELNTKLANENITPSERKRLTNQLENLEQVKLSAKHYLIISIENLLEIALRKKWGLSKKDAFIYLFNGEFWSLQDKEVFEGFLGQAAERMGVPKYNAKFFQFREQLLKQFLTTAILPTPQREEGSVLINLQNGTFEVSPSGNKLRPFNQNDFLTYQLPFDYDKEATAPKFQNYLDKVLPDRERQKVLAEFLGYLFIPNGSRRIKEEKALVLYGTGANGKSVLYEVVTALLGPANCSSFSLENLTDSSGYYRSMIGNVLVNYASEISNKLQTDIFKKITSGEPIDARLPYGKPMILTQYAKLIFNCNELPKDVEHSKAYFRRFLIIPFDVTIPEEDQDKQLHSKIIENELSGVFNWVLEGLERLLSQERFSKCQASEKALTDYEVQSDSVKLFLEEKEVEKCTLNERAIPLKELFSQYRTFCGEDGYKAVSKKSFSFRIKGFGFEMTRRNIGPVVFAYSKENSF